MQIRIANAPVSWGIMEVEGWAPLLTSGEFLDELKAAGYEGTELGPYGFLPTEPDALNKELDSRSLRLISAFVPLRLKEADTDLEPVRTVGRLLRQGGASHVVLADAMWPEREAAAGRVQQAGVQLTDAEWKTVGANIGAATREAGELGLRCVFHHHAGSYIETPGEIARLLELTDVGLCLDTGHYVYGGGDPVEAVRVFGSRVEHLHFKDVDAACLSRAKEQKLGFLDAVRAGVFCPLGAGCVRFPELLEALAQIGYDGWAVVEQDVDPAGGNGLPGESAAASREYLRTHFGL